MKKFPFRPLSSVGIGGYRKSALNLAVGILVGPSLVLAQTTPDASSETSLSQVVITARRVETKLEDVPQRVEIVDAKDIDKTFHGDLTDLLKKSASIDVIQYPGGLSGIGIRGFSPEYNGINRHSALLIDGRPASVDNLATISSGSIERVEVMKGPGSALYGSGAMGGVVNMISRQSRGDIHGQADLSVGQFATTEGKFRVGGNITEAIDFDYAGSLIKAGDFAMGNGESRPSGYTMEGHSIRAGLAINKDWRLNAKWTDWQGRDVEAPGDIAYGLNAQVKKQIATSDRDLRLTGNMGDHALTITAFSGTQYSEQTQVTSTTVSYRPQLPAVYFAGDLRFSGWQVQDAWEWSKNSVLLFGVDTQKVDSFSKTYDLGKPGAPQKGSNSADNQRLSTGFFAENSWTFNAGHSTAYIGIRRDNISNETFDSPFKTGFTPSKSDLSSTNPSAGFKHQLAPGLNLHSTIGTAFIAPNAFVTTGNTKTPRTVGGKVIYDYTVANPNINPEKSLTKDIGIEWGTRDLGVDLTIFDTEVTDRIVSVKTTDTSGGVNNGGVTTTNINGDKASIQGLEFQGHWAISKNYRLTVGGTRYAHNWTLVNRAQVDANIVPELAIKLALDADFGQWSGRLGIRYRGPMKDQDFVNGGGKQIEIAGFAVADLNVRYRIDKAQSVALSIENLGDRYYTEKFGYNMPGRNTRVNYRYEF